jgi:two-component system response regulator DesR
MIKVLFADDEPKLRQAWERLFTSQPDMELVGTLADAEGLVDAVTTLKPDIAVLDLSMPGRDPLDEIRRLVVVSPNVRTIVYTGRGDEETIRAAFDAGAWGYLDKLAPPADMFRTVRRVACGEAVFPPGLSESNA